MSEGHFPVQHTEAEWRAMLTPEQFAVLRQHATERPGSCALLHEKRAGAFTCAGCGQPCSRARPSSRAAPAGRASTRRCPARSRRRPTAATAWRAPRSIARVADRISATSSPTGRRRPACAIASMAWRPISSRLERRGDCDFRANIWALLSTRSLTASARRVSRQPRSASAAPGGNAPANCAVRRTVAMPAVSAGLIRSAHQPRPANHPAVKSRPDRRAARQSRHARGDRLLVDAAPISRNSSPTAG